MRRFLLLFLLVFTGLALTTPARAAGQIIIGAQAPELERYAALELQRYLYQLTGELPAIRTDAVAPRDKTFIVGQAATNRRIAELVQAGRLTVGPDNPGPQSYVLRRLDVEGGQAIVIAGSDEAGTLYGVYGLLDDHYGIGFYFSGDALPSGRQPLMLPAVDERKAPAAYIRGFLPWTNFPQSATVYSWEDWRFIIDQAARMRMNFIHVHNYNGEASHNEMFHNFPVKDLPLSRVWMATARSGHHWGGLGWNVSDYLFGADSLFDDYDHGADCALHNETLSNEDIFAKGVNLFQRVIDYAHTRGVKIGLGIDINLLPPEYNGKASAQDPEVIAARVKQITGDYPALDYLMCFQGETMGQGEEIFAKWREQVMHYYNGVRQAAPATKIAVAGWGMNPAAVAPLPADIICAPISAYSDSCESGAVYGQREYWGCPWLERDGTSSVHYYPYNMHLSNTVKAWQTRAPNMKGFYCLTWRLADAVDAKMSFIAKAPWDTTNAYDSSRAVYHEYAARNYGPAAADAITPIINENEPFACDASECQGTPQLTGTYPMAGSGGGVLFNIKQFRFRGAAGQAAETPMLEAVDYTKNQGSQKAGCTLGGQCLGFLELGNWLEYKDVDFGANATTFEAIVASATNGGTLQARLDDPAGGPVLGQIPVPGTGDWQKWVTLSAPIQPTSGKHTVYLCIQGLEVNDLPKAEQQLATISGVIQKTTDSARRARLGQLRDRIASERDFILVNKEFPTLPWEELPGHFGDWARDFTRRVNDISSLGNVVSTQNRLVQERYLAREQALRKAQAVKAPAWVKARGTKDGVIITWRNEEPTAKGFNVYRDGVKLTAAPLAATASEFRDQADGSFTYTVSVIGADGRESPRGVPVRVAAGKADAVPPEVIVVSPPTSVALGQPATLKARILDDRADEELKVTLRWRKPGALFWKSIPLAHRARGVFAGQIPARALGETGAEYYVEASDGPNTGVWPAAGKAQPASLVTYKVAATSAPAPPQGLAAASRDGVPALAWQPATGGVFAWRIFRGRTPDFTASPASLVTYVDARTTRFVDNGEDFDGAIMQGEYYYRLTAVDRSGNESAPTAPLRLAATPKPKS